MIALLIAVIDYSHFIALAVRHHVPVGTSEYEKALFERTVRACAKLQEALQESRNISSALKERANAVALFETQFNCRWPAL